MNSFNVYGKTEQVVGGNTPVWLGTVKPIPRGATITSLDPGVRRAGLAVIYNPETQEITFIDSVEGSGATKLASANAFLYNDVRNEGNKPVPATCAVVMHHPEGLLIERVYPEITEEQIEALQAKVPGVLLVRG